jgi:hypothetical protein
MLMENERYGSIYRDGMGSFITFKLRAVLRLAIAFWPGFLVRRDFPARFDRRRMKGAGKHRGPGGIPPDRMTPRFIGWHQVVIRTHCPGRSGLEPSIMTSENPDYDLSKPIESSVGLRQSLTSYGDAHFSLFLRKVFIKALGYSEDALSRPIVGIVNTYSSFNPCHANVPQLIEAVKRGVQLNGGLAIDFPTISIHESFSSPTSMFLRNLMSMDTEEMIKAQPVDAVVLIGGK